MVYPEPLIETREREWGPTPQLTYRFRNGRASTYGGKLTENVCQAVCRDILSDALVRVEATGHEVVLHVHDEIVCEISDESELASIKSIMSTSPPWASDLQLEVKAHVSKRYGKEGA